MSFFLGGGGGKNHVPKCNRQTVPTKRHRFKKKTLQSKTTWEDLEAYVGHKLERGDRFKAFILTYLNRDFGPLDFDDGRQYYCTQKVCKWWDKTGYLKACCGDEGDKDAVKNIAGAQSF